MKKETSTRLIARVAIAAAFMLLAAVSSRGATASEESLMRVYGAVKDYGTERLLTRAEEYIKAGEIDNAQVCLHVTSPPRSSRFRGSRPPCSARLQGRNDTRQTTDLVTMKK